MEKKYEQFLKNDALCDFQQSQQWAQVKINWINEVIAADGKDGNPKAVMSVLIRKIPLFGNLMYVPRGPVCDLHNPDILYELTKKIYELAEKYNAFIVRIEPYATVDDDDFKNIVTKLGYKINSCAKKFEEEIQARHIFRLDIRNKTKEEVFSSFSSKTRYNIRLAGRKGVEIKKLDISQIDVFCSLMQETAKRNGFIPRKKEYFERICNIFGDSAEMYAAYYQGEPLAAIMPITYGNKMWYLYGASSNKHRNVMANYLLQWNMIENAIDRGLDVYDFRGSDGNIDSNNGLYRFKISFGTKFIELIGEIYIDFKPFKSALYRITEKFFRKIRRKIYKILHS